MKVQVSTLVLILLISITSSCGLYKKTDNSVSQNAQERARQNVKEGRGIALNNIGKTFSRSNYEFATSNPMWRATLEILDFMPFNTIDYSGGIITTDWYQNSNQSDTSIKITVRFLNNEVASNSLKIIVHERLCQTNLKCETKIIQRSKIKEELITSILKKAAELKEIKK